MRRTSNCACTYTSHRGLNYATTNSDWVCNHDTKNPAPEYPTAEQGLLVVVVCQFVLGVLRTTNLPIILRTTSRLVGVSILAGVVYLLVGSLTWKTSHSHQGFL